MTMKSHWEWGAFAVSTTGGRQWRYGSFWSHWGTYCPADKWFAVPHIPTGMRITRFPKLRIVRRFCEQIDGPADWTALDGTAKEPELDFSLRLHRAALRVTGARPALICITDGALDESRR